MSDDEFDPKTGAMIAEPPEPPPAPPTAAAPSPDPNRRRRLGCLIAALIAGVLLAGAAGLGGYLWLRSQTQRPAPATPAELDSAVASALRKAEVTFPALPSGEISLVSIKPTGSHRFEATFTYEELTALLKTFTYTPKSMKNMGFSVHSITLAAESELRAYGDVTANGITASGWIQGPVRFAEGKIEPTGDYTANMNGITIRGSQAAQTGNMTIAYLNAYLAAAPGLEIDSAIITDAGIHVTGTAPDRISW